MKTPKYMSIAQYMFGNMHLFHYSILPPYVAMNGHWKGENLKSVHLLNASKICWKRRNKFLLKKGGCLDTAPPHPGDSFILLLLSDRDTRRFWKRLTSRLQTANSVGDSNHTQKTWHWPLLPSWPNICNELMAASQHPADLISPNSFTDTTLQMLILPSWSSH